MEHAGGYGSASLHAPHERYLESLARLVRWLLDNDYDVKLLLGDSDTAVVDELKSVLKQQPGSFPADRVSSDPVTSPEDLFLQLVATDFVVATRFHNVLMSLMLGKPVIAITFHHKSSSLMDEMGLSEYCHDIADIDGDRLVEQFQALVRNADELRDAIGRHVDEERRAVDEQYQLLFGSAVERPTARAAAA
jgi:polysaccharide pyruvyl transferase WcaK-like protein